MLITSVALLLAPLLSPAPPQDELPSADRTRIVVLELAEAMRTRYVFEETGSRCAKFLLDALETGELPLDDAEKLARRLHKDLREETHDAHLRVTYRPGPRTEPAEESWRTPGRSYNHGFRKVERLAGNVGYLELTGFHDPMTAGETALAAMTFLRESDALVLDLRRNGGGSAEMVKLVASWVLPPETPLSGIEWRATGVQQAWTVPRLDTRRLTEVPVFVLTSEYTFSAAEALAYDLQTARRALVVGERTGGGAHPGDTVDLGAGFSVWMPTGRAVHPSTGSNWERTGVAPDIAVPSTRALRTAHALALEAIMSAATDDARRRALKWTLEWARATADPRDIGAEERRALCGTYEAVQIGSLGETLTWSSAEHGTQAMVPLGDHEYCLKDHPDIRLSFERNRVGRVTALIEDSSHGTRTRRSRLEPSPETP